VTAIDLPRLQRLLGGAGRAGLRQKLRRRFEQGKPDGTFTLSALTASERDALEQLLGRRMKSASSMRLTLQELDVALAACGAAADTRAALTALDGPIIERAAQRQMRDRQWQQTLTTARQPRLRALLDADDGCSLLKRIARGDVNRAQMLLVHAATVLDALPGHGIGRSRLAALTLGDAHALDDGALATLVLRAAVPIRNDDDETTNRERWAELGVIVDGLSRPVLTLNLPGAPDWRPGEPLHLSLRHLLGHPSQWQVQNREVFVCENPAIVTLAADELGPRSAPLVCTDGMPAAAQRSLLAQLVQAGAKLRYHGDFDWPGLRIGNFVMRRFHARPWRFGTADYRPRGGRLLRGSAAVADWDATLAPAMQSGRYALEEEAVAEVLLEDLAGR
jgi:uncharacterized protein (TIGR02679 family)